MTRVRLYWQLLMLAAPLMRAVGRRDEEQVNRIVSEVDRIHQELGH